ncbi:MAG: hypothetical protein K8J08_02940 [Thermoanaerobaculia bacterium]|nr:hypothetical protein [Thermoanaerobaculia bacterium]
MKKLGQILIDNGWLTLAKVQQALQHQQIFGGRLGTCLLELNLVTEDKLGNALGIQSGVPVATVEDLRSIPEPVLQLIPARMAFKSKVLPFDRYSTEARVAMINTRDLILQDELAFVTSKRLKIFIAPEIRVLEALEKHYGCDIDQRYQRIWDRLNRARYLWQDTESPPGTPDAVKSTRKPDSLPTLVAPDADAVGRTRSQWHPSPAPHLDDVAAPRRSTPQAPVTPKAPVPSPTPRPVTPPRAPEAAKETVPTTAAASSAPSVVPAPATPPSEGVSSAPERSSAPTPPSEAKPITVEIAGAATSTGSVAGTSSTPDSAPEEGGTSESVSTRPMPSMATPESIDDLEDRMMEAEERDHIAHALVLYLTERFARVLCFMVRGDEVAGWMGTGRDVDESKLEAFRLDFDSPSLFLNLKAGIPIYRGPLPKMEAHEGLIEIWGGRYPRECLLMPVHLKGRMVAVLYLDKGGKALGGVDLGEIQRIGGLTSRAFEAFLVRRRAQSRAG